MISENDKKIIEKTAEEFFNKTTIEISRIDVSVSLEKSEVEGQENKDVVDLEIKIADEPQILIGQGGQTLFEIQRLLRNILNKKLEKVFYLNLDINDYKKKKVEYLKSLAKDLADEVALSKTEKALPPMSSYERRVVHAELAKRVDITTASQGEGFDRHIVIKSK